MTDNDGPDVRWDVAEDTVSKSKYPKKASPVCDYMSQKSIRQYSWWISSKYFFEKNWAKIQAKCRSDNQGSKPNQTQGKGGFVVKG